MPLTALAPSDRQSSSVWIVLGVLREIVSDLGGAENLDDFWRRVFDRARWLVPAYRVGVVLENETGDLVTVARGERGQWVPLDQEERLCMQTGMVVQACQARIGTWLEPSWAEESEVDPLRRWLLAPDPATVLALALEGPDGVRGGMLFAFESLRLEDRPIVMGVARAYALHVATTFGLVRAREQLAVLNTRLRRKVDELEEFALAASHDLQAPLRMIAGFGQLLAEQYGDALGEEGQTFLDHVTTGASSMSRMLEGLLSYGRMDESTEPHLPVDLGEMATLATRNLTALVSETGAEIRHDTLPTVLADGSNMVRLFQNLFANAIRYRSEVPPRIHVSVDRSGDQWVLSVADNGVGISPELHEAVFEVFHTGQSSDRHPSTGVGLAICRKIVSRHGGRIWVQSAAGRGSTFRFTLPVLEAAS